MTEQEAINHLPIPTIITNDIAGEENMFNKEQIAHNLAIQALKKQIPMKPRFKPFDDDNLEDGTLCCPNCGEFLTDYVSYDWQKYCMNCGQKLDWSD